MIYCRYCGAAIAPDSVFCAKCGKKLVRRPNPKLERIVEVLHLRTPYPYSAFLILAIALWTLVPEDKPGIDFSHLQWSLEVDRNLDLPEERLFQQGFSLVLENTGPAAVSNIPVELTARIEPAQPAEIVANFLGARLSIMHEGKTLPLIVVLSDEVRPGAKRHYSVEGAIEAAPPFKVTYEVRQEGADSVLASYVVER